MRLASNDAVLPRFLMRFEFPIILIVVQVSSTPRPKRVRPSARRNATSPDVRLPIGVSPTPVGMSEERNERSPNERERPLGLPTANRTSRRQRTGERGIVLACQEDEEFDRDRLSFANRLHDVHSALRLRRRTRFALHPFDPGLSSRPPSRVEVVEAKA
jgi:hypothetical protein